MKILITGSSGFIGFHLLNRLLKNKNNRILGIDSMNNYYSPNIKYARLRLLKKYRNFYFVKMNLNNKNKLDKVFNNFRPKIIIHLAGQPGVLYSFKNPKSYKQNNIEATKVLATVSKKYDVKKFIFGSSSSVYGDQKNFPIKENFKKNPKNYYAQTKFKCEEMVKKRFPKKFQIFRFFTVYGPYGRPDMFIHKLLKSFKSNKIIKLHNFGNNFRDFTYIDDVIDILEQSISYNYKNKVLNICRSRPLKNTKLISIIQKIYKKKIDIKSVGKIKGEMLITHGSNELLKLNTNLKSFTSIEKGLKKTVNIFKKFNM